MTVEELYTEIGGDYKDALGRLMTSDLVARFIVKFPEDEASRDLPRVWATGDEQAAFRAAHTARGVCANLSITSLSELAGQITEALREGHEELRATTDVDALVARYAERYAQVVAAIQTFEV